MAHVLLVTNSPLLRVFYTIDEAVGSSCLNKRDDVMLVQLFLASLAPKVDPDTKESFRAPDQGDLAVDGVCGPRTRAYISHFQGVMNRAAGFVKFGTWQDGRVDPVPPGQGAYGPRHGQTYTMIHLNTSYASVFGTDRHSALGSDPNFPAALRTKFFIN
jgi:hypothetical protein